jgi:hypothetical protein
MGTALEFRGAQECQHRIDYNHGCFVTGDDGEARQWREAEANARLIASAPCLLEALKTVRDYVSDMAEGHIQQTPALTAMAHEDLARIDAAIAKAAGEAA